MFACLFTTDQFWWKHRQVELFMWGKLLFKQRVANICIICIYSKTKHCQMNTNIKIIRIIINTIHEKNMHASQLSLLVSEYAALPTDLFNFAPNDVPCRIENIPHIAEFTRANMSPSPWWVIMCHIMRTLETLIFNITHIGWDGVRSLLSNVYLCWSALAPTPSQSLVGQGSHFINPLNKHVSRFSVF